MWKSHPALNSTRPIWEIKNKQVPLAEIFIFANLRENLRPASFSFPGTSGSHATQDLASASPNLPPDFAQAHFAQQFRFGAQAPSTPALNSAQRCFGDNFQSRFRPPLFFHDFSSVTAPLQV